MDKNQHEKIVKSHDFAICIKKIAEDNTPLTTAQAEKIYEYAEQIEYFLKPLTKKQWRFNFKNT